MSGERLYTAADLAAAEEAAYRRAADSLTRDTKLISNVSWRGDYDAGMSDSKHLILALIPQPSALEEFERKVRLEEAEWWAKYSPRVVELKEQLAESRKLSKGERHVEDGKEIEV